MLQAKTRNITLTMLDAIAPKRERFRVVDGGRRPKNNTMALIDRLGAELAAKGPVFPQPKAGPKNLYVNNYGKILDPEKAAQWDMAQREGGAK